MADWNCNGSCVTMNLIRKAIIGTGRQPAVARMGVQLVRVQELAECMAINAVRSAKEAVETVKQLMATYQPTTIAGIPIEIDYTVPPDVIEFRDSNGVISRLKNLSVPI